jgi:hypothetical protein
MKSDGSHRLLVIGDRVARLFRGIIARCQAPEVCYDGKSEDNDHPSCTMDTLHARDPKRYLSFGRVGRLVIVPQQNNHSLNTHSGRLEYILRWQYT